jgi:catechol 2,3-dioxygenase-like lactoylglutathione lyase family enzyme
MQGTLEKAWGYQGDKMNLPVRDLAAALPFYENVLGFSVLSRSEAPHHSAVLARDQVEIGLAENGGDSAQDGCAFHVKGLESLFAEFKANGLHKELSEFNIEKRDGVAWKVFYVVAPDGLCYWFGERHASDDPLFTTRDVKSSKCAEWTHLDDHRTNTAHERAFPQLQDGAAAGARGAP